MEYLESIIDALSAYLDKFSVCTEHDLIQHCKALNIEPYSQLDMQHSKDLFCAHFLTKHALYKLQDRYQQSQTYCLEITVTRIIRHNYHIGRTAIIHHNALKSYYLDISHYFETSEDQVNQLLSSFWKRFLAQDDKHQALATLGLPLDSDYSTIKKTYRSLAQKAHPDKGGCPEEFSKISAAKALLDSLYL